MLGAADQTELEPLSATGGIRAKNGVPEELERGGGSQWSDQSSADAMAASDERNS